MLMFTFQMESGAIKTEKPAKIITAKQCLLLTDKNVFRF